MSLKHYDSFSSWYDEMTDSDPYPGIDIRLNLSRGLTGAELRDAANQLDNTCCGSAEGLGVVNGEVYWRFVDFGH